jgi:hypothetical protein
MGNPFDVVKTGMQAPKRVNTRIRLTCFKQINKRLEEGFRPFYAGVVPRLGRVVPGRGNHLHEDLIRKLWRRRKLLPVEA